MARVIEDDCFSVIDTLLARGDGCNAWVVPRSQPRSAIKARNAAVA
jgi:hypothetical protein